MTARRILLFAVILTFALVGPVSGANQMRAFVPANAYHAEQELVVGQAGEIYIEVTSDVDLYTVVVSLEAANLEGSTRLWSPIVDADIEWLIPDDALGARSFGESQQSNDWPDSLHMWALKLMDNALPAGTHQFMRMTVMPINTGTVVFTDAFVNGHWCEFHDGTTLFRPEVVLPDITIVQLDDCNLNGIPDVQELAEGTALDCNSNGYPDECDIVGGIELDCNQDGVPDACELAAGTALDSNSNLIPDECDPDLNFNGIPDDCDDFQDCNFNGVSDANDISGGLSSDTNTNGIPDECEGLAGNFVRIFVPPDVSHGNQELLVGYPGHIVMALINDVTIDAAVIPFEFSSGDGTPLWEPLTSGDGHFLFPMGGSDVRSLFTNRQGGTWPDTLNLLHAFFNGASLPPGFHPLLEMTVVPTGTGTVSWAGAPLPPDPTPPTFVISSTGAEMTVEVMGADVSIVHATDCNENGIPDPVELADGSALDCNSNGQLDECEVADGEVYDCNSNGVPDECDPDLNSNGVPDDCEGDEGEDCNFNGIADLIDISLGSSADVNTNGIPDECEGLAGNYVSIYAPPDQQLVVGQPGDIYVAVVNDVVIEAAAIPFRYNSGDGTPLWGTVGETDFEFFDPNQFADLVTNRQGGNWPDTLSVLQLLVTGGEMPVGFNRICRITVIPTTEGIATFEVAPTPPTLAPAALVTAGGGPDILVDIVADPVTVILSCCQGRVGDANMVGGDEPTIGDISLIIDYLFISGAPLTCLTEADVNQSGGANPVLGDITIGDISRLIAYLFLDGTPLYECF